MRSPRLPPLPKASSQVLQQTAYFLAADGVFACDHMTYPYGAHVAVVSIDREIGALKVERYLAAYDVGVAINPMLVEGQIAGSMVQGLGGALLEEFVYDDTGTPLCLTFSDYLMPTVADVPDLDVLISEDGPSPLNPLGVKGAGESGITGVGAAIASAVYDALGLPGAVKELPITPLRLRKIITSMLGQPDKRGHSHGLLDHEHRRNGAQDHQH